MSTKYGTKLFYKNYSNNNQQVKQLCSIQTDVRINLTILESALKFEHFFEHLLQFNSPSNRIDIWREILQALLS